MVAVVSWVYLISDILQCANLYCIQLLPEDPRASLLLLVSVVVQGYSGICLRVSLKLFLNYTAYCSIQKGCKYPAGRKGSIAG